MRRDGSTHYSTFRHSGRNLSLVQCKVDSCTFLEVESNSGSLCSYAIKEVVSIAVDLLRKQESTESDSSNLICKMSKSTKNVNVRNRLVVPGTGLFIAYSNGSAHVEFEDGACVDLEGIGITSQFNNGLFYYTAHGRVHEGRMRHGTCLGVEDEEIKRYMRLDRSSFGFLIDALLLSRVRSAREFLEWCTIRADCGHSASCAGTHLQKSRPNNMKGLPMSAFALQDAQTLNTYVPPPSMSNHRSKTNHFLQEITAYLGSL